MEGAGTFRSLKEVFPPRTLELQPRSEESLTGYGAFEISNEESARTYWL